MAEHDLPIEERIKRVELAISAMAQWLVESHTGFDRHDAKDVEAILQGKISARNPKEQNNPDKG